MHVPIVPKMMHVLMAFVAVALIACLDLQRRNNEKVVWELLDVQTNFSNMQLSCILTLGIIFAPACFMILTHSVCKATWILPSSSHGGDEDLPCPDTYSSLLAPADI